MESNRSLKNMKQYTSGYRKPRVVKPVQRSGYKDMLLRVKNYFSIGKNEQIHGHRREQETGMAVPGGFFSEKATGSAPENVHIRPGSSKMLESFDATQDDDVSMIEDSNVTLARFFEKKGNEPLSDVEMEGVLSILSKTQSANSSRIPSRVNSVLANDSGFLKSGTPSLGMRTSSRVLPNDVYTPQFDSPVHPNNNNNNNNDNKVSRKRVFDFSAVPSPCRVGGIYKPHVLVSENEKSVEDSAPEAADSTTIIDSGKLTKTASALVSLLADTEKSKTKVASSKSTSTEKKIICNPYSTFSPQFKKVEVKPVAKIPDFKNKTKKTKASLPAVESSASKMVSFAAPAKAQAETGLATNISKPKEDSAPAKSAFTFSFTPKMQNAPAAAKSEKKETISFAKIEQPAKQKSQSDEPKPVTTDKKLFNPAPSSSSSSSKMFTFGKPKQNVAEIASSVAAKPKTAYTYDFPDAKVVLENASHLDLGKADAFKPLFGF